MFDNVKVLLLGDKLLTFGGVNINQQPTNCVEVYDATKKEWILANTLKDASLGVSVVVRGITAIYF